MHFNIILCFWAHLDSCSLLWTHFRGAGNSGDKIFNIRKKSIFNDSGVSENQFNIVFYNKIYNIKSVSC